MTMIRSESGGRGFITMVAACMLSFLGVAAGQTADVVYLNGRIYTMDVTEAWAEAVAIRGDRFVYVGDDEGVQAWIGAETKVTDLQGSFVIPGMYDMHVHPDLLFEPVHMNQIQTSPLGPQELARAIREHAEANPGDGWIFGGTWAPDRFAGAGVEPGAAFLDSIMPDRPVAIVDSGRHVLITNTLAMELAGVDADTFEPDHGMIKRDADGNPVGYFADGAQSALSHVLPQGTWREFAACYKDAAALLNRYGFVGARAMHVNTPRLQGVQSLDRAGELTVRYDMAISWKNDLYFSVPDRANLLTGERHRYRSAHVNANHVKFHLDGTPVSKTALFLDPYRGSTTNFGSLNEGPQELFDLMVQLERDGVTANIHAIGDGAARLAMDAIEHARQTVGLPADRQPRHLLAHSTVIHDDDCARIAELNMVAEFSYSMMHPTLAETMVFLAGSVVSDESMARLWNVKRVLESKGRAVLGSDLVVAPDPNVFPAMSTLIDRPEGYASISVVDALLMLTRNGAWAMGIEDIAGSIEVGKYADFAVLDRNLLEATPGEIAETEVLLTVFEGLVVYTFDQDVVPTSPRRAFGGMCGWLSPGAGQSGR